MRSWSARSSRYLGMLHAQILHVESWSLAKVMRGSAFRVLAAIHLIVAAASSRTTTTKIAARCSHCGSIGSPGLKAGASDMPPFKPASMSSSKSGRLHLSQRLRITRSLPTMSATRPVIVDCAPTVTGPWKSLTAVVQCVAAKIIMAARNNQVVVRSSTGQEPLLIKPSLRSGVYLKWTSVVLCLAARGAGIFSPVARRAQKWCAGHVFAASTVSLSTCVWIA
jgi:hypothetical protein